MNTTTTAFTKTMNDMAARAETAEHFAAMWMEFGEAMRQHSEAFGLAWAEFTMNQADRFAN